MLALKLNAGVDAFNSDEGVVYVLSIGINKYNIKNPSISTANSESDALQFGQFIQNHKGGRKVVEFILTNNKATVDSVVSVINYINNNAKKEDYFFFYFGGFSWDYPPVSSDIHFFLHSNSVIDITENTTPNPAVSISLSKLQALLEFNKAKNQMLISEAGMSSNFRKIMQKSLLTKDKSISALIDRNRIILAPRSIGYDNIYCDSINQRMGPLMYFITRGLSIDPNVTIFDFFSENIVKRNQAEFAVFNMEVRCDFYVKMYTGIYFEKDILKDLDLQPGEEEGVIDLKENKHNEHTQTVNFSSRKKNPIKASKALIVAVDQYVKGSGWSKLYNPVLDADTIASLLKNNYNFEVQVLRNSTKDSILMALRKYASTLDSNDQFLFYFSGHGYFDTTFYHDGFFVMKNSLNPLNDPTLTNYLPFNSIRSILDNLKSKQVMFIVDACFSGNADVKEKAVNSGKTIIDINAELSLLENLKPVKGFTEDELEALSRDYKNESAYKYVSDLMNRKTRILIAAGSKKVPDGYAGLHSPMTALIIKLLENNGGNKDFLSSYDIYRYISALPSNPVLGQLPQDERGEFILKPTNK